MNLPITEGYDGLVILSEAKDPLIHCISARPEGILRFAQDDTRSLAS